MTFVTLPSRATTVRISLVSLGAILFALWFNGLLARSDGIEGYSGNPATNGGAICNQCHSGGTTPTVVLGGPTSVIPSSTNIYTLTITGGQQVAGGLGVSATMGALAISDIGIYLSDGEILHSSPRPADGSGAVSWNFAWTAPASEGFATLYGAGNSVNLGQGTNNDRANSDTLTIIVANAGPQGPGESSSITSQPLRVVGFNSTTGNLSLSYETGCETTGNNVYYGPLGSVGFHGWSGELCDIGVSGTLSSFNPGSGSYFFVVVGHNAQGEGSYGLQSGSPAERPPFAANACGETQDLADRCD